MLVLGHGTGAAWYWSCIWIFRLALSSHLFSSFAFRDTNTDCLLTPRNTRCGNACFGAQVGSKNGTWYSKRVILQFMCVGCSAGITNLRYNVLTSPKKGETAVHRCDPALSVLVTLVSRNVFHVVSALQSIVSINSSHFNSIPIQAILNQSINYL